MLAILCMTGMFLADIDDTDYIGTYLASLRARLSGARNGKTCIPDDPKNSVRIANRLDRRLNAHDYVAGFTFLLTKTLPWISFFKRGRMYQRLFSIFFNVV